jgi:hypothetical protein
VHPHERRRSLLVGALALASLFAPTASAFEFFDQRLQIHGFAEVQLRAIARDFDQSDGIDLTQWYNVLNVEVDYAFVRDGWGPFLFLSAFARLEVRYDCVWSRACGLARSADAYGDRANKLPRRLSDRRPASGFTLDDGTAVGEEFVGAARVEAHTGALLLPDHRAGGLNTSSLGALQEGANLVTIGASDVDGDGNPDPGTPSNPTPLARSLFGRFDDFRFAQIDGPRYFDGRGGFLVGPYLPKNFVRSIGYWRDIPNPFNDVDFNPVTQSFGTDNGLGFRPPPRFDVGDPTAPAGQAQGAYVPSAGLRRILGNISTNDADQNFRQAELAWNRGASQQDEKELKELYLDFELLDGALWGRIGKQTIVWGKTELFFNYDQFEPNDLGDCGEPYTPDPVCNLKAQGLYTHGVTALGLAGEERPDNPWESTRGIEGGARVEFRWKRFSFAITDFYGYDDSSTTIKYAVFERNVDPDTGRPRAFGERGPCVSGAEPACLQPGNTGPNNALDFQPANYQLFTAICASTVGILESSLLANTENCLGTLFNALPIGPTFFSALLASNLNVNVGDTGPAGTLSGTLSDEQQALLGCGAFFGTNCNSQGIDLLNAEASVLFQSWLSFDGVPDPGEIVPGATAYTPAVQMAYLTDPRFPKPGTVEFDGGPVGTRLVSSIDAQLYTVLPGARRQFLPGGAVNPNWEPLEDGDATGLMHPLSPMQQFNSELAALSWNFLNAMVISSTPAADCSITAPLGCNLVSGFMGQINVQSPLISSRDPRFGRRDFVWHGAAPTYVTYDKNNILGFSADFAEDRTATSWNLEFTWVNDRRMPDAEVFEGPRTVDQYNLTISVDRPTFVRFLNRSRAFFVNMQAFVGYIDGYRSSMPDPGPYTARNTLTIATGYFQDRLNPAVTFVYDWKTNSGAVLTSVAYRFSDEFSVALGVSGFFGRFKRNQMSVSPSSLTNRVGANRFNAWTTPGLSVVQNRDEISLRIRYSF